MTRALVVLMGVLAVVVVSAAQGQPDRLGLGEPAPRELIAALDVDVRPDGTGLPPGNGTAAAGAGVYARQCAACHGPKGEGGIADRLIGPDPKGIAPFGPAYEKWREGRPDVPFTIGNYWPYATTLFDYILRTMPTTAPGTLSADEIYSVVAWLLAENGIIAADATMNAQTLPKVMMPARGRFVPDDRTGGPQLK
jgi:cytochrome c